MFLARAKRANGIMMQGFLYEDQLRPVAELERMRDILSMGLPDAHEASVSLVSAGVTPEMLFRVFANRNG